MISPQLCPQRSKTASPPACRTSFQANSFQHNARPSKTRSPGRATLVSGLIETPDKLLPWFLQRKGRLREQGTPQQNSGQREGGLLAGCGGKYRKALQKMACCCSAEFPSLRSSHLASRLQAGVFPSSSCSQTLYPHSHLPAWLCQRAKTGRLRR